MKLLIPVFCLLWATQMVRANPIAVVEPNNVFIAEEALDIRLGPLAWSKDACTVASGGSASLPLSHLGPLKITVMAHH